MGSGSGIGANPQVSVLMPTFNQAPFIWRAVESLLAQTLSQWELLIVDDGSSDRTPEVLTPYLGDPRVRSWRLPRNRGIGAALNCGLDHASAPLIAYLPSDDLYYHDHLASLVACLESDPTAVLAYSGVRYRQRNNAPGRIEGSCLQLVQVMHRRGRERWVEREELITDDFNRLFWEQLTVATQSLARKLDIGLFSKSVAGLGTQLRNEARIAQLRANVWRQRERFTFDYHADRLLEFFREVMAHPKERLRR